MGRVYRIVGPTKFPSVDLDMARLNQSTNLLAEKLVPTDLADVAHFKNRSGLATAAGFTGLALIFSRFSVAPLIWAQFPRMFDLNNPHEAFLSTLFLLSIPVPGLVAPFALWLGAKAWLQLDANTNKCSKIQAGFAFVIGVLGTGISLIEIYQVMKALMNPI